MGLDNEVVTFKKWDDLQLLPYRVDAAGNGWVTGLSWCFTISGLNLIAINGNS